MTDAARFRKIEAVFVAASRRPPEEREEFLRAECADDSSIRIEVEAMLAHADDPALDTPLRLDPVRVPERIGGYDVVRRIGLGGMGAVYEAEQSQPHRRVAVKVVRPDALSQEMLGRFRHEAEVLGRLQHPGIAQIFEASIDREQPYFVMEYIDGRPLTEFARQRALTERQRLELVAEICDAVHHAHEQGVVHRDLKSDNVLVTSDGRPKVLDFGVARVIDSGAALKTQWTTAGQLVGTLAYMSPEQVRGSPDARTDVYALGVILYELLAGRLPFDFKGVSITEAGRIICEDDPPRLARDEIDAILGKALEKEKRRRYASAAALATDLRRYLANLPVTARPATAWYQLRKYARRHRIAVTGAAATVLALVVGLVSTTIQAVRATRHAAIAERNEARAQRTAYRASVAAASSSLARGDAQAARRALDEAPAELRRWEWRHLNARLDVTETIFRTEPGPRSIAFRPNGTALFASASGVIDVGTGKPILKALRQPIAVALSGDGATVATVDADLALRIRATETGRLQAETKLTLKEPLLALQLGPEGSVLAACSRSEMHFIDSRTGELRARHRIDPPAQYAAAFLGNGERIAVQFSRDRVRLVDTRTGAIAAEERMPGCFRAIAASPDGSRVASGTDPQTHVTRILDGGTLTKLGRIGGHPGFAWCAAFSTDGRLLATGSPERIVIHDAVSFEQRRSLFLSGIEARALRWSPDGSRLLVAAENEVRVVRWDAPPFRELTGHESFVYSAAWSADGSMIASAGWDRTVRLWDAGTGAPLAVLQVESDCVGFVGFTRDGTRVLAWDGDIYVAWDVATGQRSETYGPDHGLIASLARGGAKWTRAGAGGQDSTTSPDGTLLFESLAGRPGQSGSGVTEVATGTGRVVLPVRDGRTRAVAVSFDNRVLAAAGATGTIRLWDAATGESLGALGGGRGTIYGIEFSPDGERLVSGGDDGRVVLWDVESRKQVVALRPHESYVHVVAFSPDGSRILSGSGDHTLRVWDSLPWSERQEQIRAATALQASARPQVERLLDELKDPAKVAARLRADETLDAAHRRAALRVLLARSATPRPG